MVPDGERASADAKDAAQLDSAAGSAPSETPSTDSTPSASAPTASPSQPSTPPEATDDSTDESPDESSDGPAARDRDQKKSDNGSADEPADDVLDETLPDDSGTGYRVVFSESRQQVWLVDDDESVDHTYLVSGSVYDDDRYDNLEPGTYSVYSRSEAAVGISDSGTMKYFVRFTRGPSGAAIGFHDIPVSDGELVQSVDELGTPQSHGCIRQLRDDAIELWEFAPMGTTVVVTA